MGLHNTDCGATVNFANWYLNLVYGTETDPTLMSFSNETWINITGLVHLRLCYFLKPSNCMRNCDISQQDNPKLAQKIILCNLYLVFLEQNMRHGIMAPTFNRP